jgi:hypothetical protein
VASSSAAVLFRLLARPRFPLRKVLVYCRAAAERQALERPRRVRDRCRTAGGVPYCRHATGNAWSRSLPRGAPRRSLPRLVARLQRVESESVVATGKAGATFPTGELALLPSGWVMASFLVLAFEWLPPLRGEAATSAFLTCACCCRASRAVALAWALALLFRL